MRETKLWSWHVFAGVLLLLLLGVHMFIMHLGEVLAQLTGAGKHLEVLSYASVSGRASPAMALFYLLFAGAALYHGLYGLRNILCELTTKTVVRTAVSTILLLGGVLLFAYGAYAALAGAVL